MRRRKQPRDVLRRIEVTLSGRRIKTVRSRITIGQAEREMSGQYLCTAGDMHRIRRRINRALVITISYTATASLVTDGRPYQIDVNAARQIIRNGLAG